MQAAEHLHLLYCAPSCWRTLNRCKEPQDHPTGAVDSIYLSTFISSSTSPGSPLQGWSYLYTNKILSLASVGKTELWGILEGQKCRWWEGCRCP